MNDFEEKILLTQFSKHAGCSCKISPKILQEILTNTATQNNFEKLLVGNNTADDAAVYDLGNDTALISTTDFFTPVVNDAFEFGKIAAANAISDVYAMGGKPIMALAILGLPIEKIPAAIASQILQGAQFICKQANIPLAGGHSIDIAEPIFGLSVNGLVKKNELLKNNTAHEGDLFYLTKPLGMGILTSAEKKNLLTNEERTEAIKWMSALNSIGEKLGALGYVSALTDVTGFGLAGQLMEMCDKKRCSAELYWHQIKILESAKMLAAKGIRPDASSTNWSNYGNEIGYEPELPVMDIFNFLPDPQTSGGLLIAIDANKKNEFEIFLSKNNLTEFSNCIGRIISPQEKTILVKK